MYRLIISPQAKKELKKIKKVHQSIIRPALKELQQEPLLVGKPLTKELMGKFSLKINVYRIIYKLNKNNKIVTILAVGHRATVYK